MITGFYVEVFKINAQANIKQITYIFYRIPMHLKHNLKNKNKKVLTSVFKRFDGAALFCSQTMAFVV